MSDNRPIGVLDSGVGGLSVLKEIKSSLPKESIVYFADNLHCPYGTKSVEELREITKRVIEFLLKKNCKLIVIACNSITSVFIEELRKDYKIPFIGIEPATLVAARQTKNHKIGVLATKTTLKSKLFNKTKEKVTSDVKVELKIGAGLVELVEEGELDGKRAIAVVKENLRGFKKKDVDQVVLGCTHYPFLLDVMKKELASCEFINPALAVSKQIEKTLRIKKLTKTEKDSIYEIYFSKECDGLGKLLRKVGICPTVFEKKVIF